MKEIRITVTVAKTRIKPETTAAELLERCRQFYQDPQNEKEYQEWKKAKKNR